MKMRYFETRKARIEIIPMIDVMLFLLVFFIIVTLQMIPDAGVSLQLPVSSQTDALPHPKFTVNVLADGTSTRVKIDLFPEYIRHLPPEKRVVWDIVGRALCSESVKAAFVRRLAPAGREVVHAGDPGVQLVQGLANGIAGPAQAKFRLPLADTTPPRPGRGQAAGPGAAGCPAGCGPVSVI